MNPTRDIVIYGFKPYLRYSENITESIIKEINSREIGRGLVFDVEFDRKMLTIVYTSYEVIIVGGKSLIIL